MNRIKSNRIIQGDRIIKGYVYYEGDKITEVSQNELAFDFEYDAGDLYVAPGFIDMHTHGGGGYSFDGSEEDIVNACNFHLKHGTTSICPTISAAPIDYMYECGKRIKNVMEKGDANSNILGSHFEGPYLSTAQCGAQSTDYIVPPKKEDYSKVIKNLGNSIKRWTYAPENDKMSEFCAYLKEHNILPSAGHTDAIYDDMKSAKQKGLNLVTHFYSCTSTITRDHGFRRLGVIETAYLEDDFYVEIIADGKHLPPELIKLILKIKGCDKVALCTDSLHLAGTNQTHGFMQSTEYIIEDGVCKLSDRSAFAGSIATADRLVRVMTQDVGVSICDAVKMITKVPAEILGINKGELKKGKDADIVVFDDNININKVLIMGKEMEM